MGTQGKACALLYAKSGAVFALPRLCAPNLAKLNPSKPLLGRPRHQRPALISPNEEDLMRPFANILGAMDCDVEMRRHREAYIEDKGDVEFGV
jgi:hypothetical protein